MSRGRGVMPRIAEAREVSAEYLLAEAVIDEVRGISVTRAAALDLLDVDRPGWRERLGRAEVIGGLMLARADGLEWREVIRLVCAAAREVRAVELRRGEP